MKGFSALVVMVIMLFSFGIVANSSAIEAKISNDGFLGAALTWDITSNLLLALSLGLQSNAWGIQTSSMTIQSRSWTIGLSARYEVKRLQPLLTPYVSAGIHGKFCASEMTAFLEALIGIHLHLNENFYVLGEFSTCAPALDIADWRWRFFLGAGLRFAF